MVALLLLIGGGAAIANAESDDDDEDGIDDEEEDLNSREVEVELEDGRVELESVLRVGEKKDVLRIRLDTGGWGLWTDAAGCCLAWRPFQAPCWRRLLWSSSQGAPSG